MRSSSVLCCTGLLVALLLPGSEVRADFVSFSYSWSFDPNPPVYPSGTGSIALAPGSGGPVSSEIGGPATLIPAATVTTTSSATAGSPDSFDVAYSLTLQLSASGESADLTFSGALSGELTATTSTVTATFNNPITQETHLGGYVYLVTINPSLIHLPAPGATPLAQINALVQVRETPVLQESTPEPSGLVLAGVGLAAAGWSCWRRQRASKNTPIVAR